MFDTKASKMEDNLIYADYYAQSLGLTAGSDAYGLTVLTYTQALNDIDDRATERYDRQLMFIALFSLSNMNTVDRTNFTTNQKVINAKNSAVDWLGKDTKMITNSNGDKVFISADGTRRIRFDINHPAQHMYPHAHVEEFVNGVWKKLGPIFPFNIPK